MNALPAILWIIGAAVSLLVCAVTVMSSHYRDGRANEVRPVTWTVIGGHVASFVLLAAPYVVYLANSASIGAHARSLYTKLGWASAAVAVALVMVELVLMYLQARRAMLAQEARASVQQDVPAPSERCGSDGDDDDKPSSLW